MVELLARIVAIGFVAALVPVPVLVVLIILAGPRGLARAWWFVPGFAGSLLVAGAAALLLASYSRASVDSNVLSAIGLVIGVACLLAAARLARSRRDRRGVPGAGNPALTAITGGRSVALGVVAGALNPKTLPIFLTGVAAIAVDGQSPMTRSLALVLLAATASVGVALPPLVLTAAPGQRTANALERVRRAAEPHAAVVAILLLALVGLVYVAFGVAGLR